MPVPSTRGSEVPAGLSTPVFAWSTPDKAQTTVRVRMSGRKKSALKGMLKGVWLGRIERGMYGVFQKLLDKYK